MARISRFWVGILILSFDVVYFMNIPHHVRVRLVSRAGSILSNESIALDFEDVFGRYSSFLQSCYERCHFVAIQL